MDNTNAPIAPDTYTGGGIKASMPSSFAVFQEDPILKISNEKASQDHAERSMDVVGSLSKVIAPNASPEDRIAGAELIKQESKEPQKPVQDHLPIEDQIPGDAPGSHEFRWSDLLGHPNAGSAIKAYKGGADQRVEAYDSNNNRYFKVYNQRTSEANPFGEFRRYEDEHWKPLTNKQIAEAGIISSIKEIPLQHQNAYINQGITAKAAAQNQAEYGNRTANIATMLAGSVPQLKSNALREKEITQALEPFSLSPKVQAVIAGIHSTVYGAQRDAKQASETFSKIANGTAKNSEVEDFLKKNGDVAASLGIAGGKYAEGKGYTKADGTRLTNEEASGLTSAISNAINQSAEVQSTKQDKLDQAILLSAGLNQKVIDQIREYKDLSFVDAKIQNDLERMGYAVQRPTVPHEQSNSYVYAGAKARQNELYADIANKYLEKTGQYLGHGKAPAVGAIELAVNTDPETQALRMSHQKELVDFLKSKEDIYKNINTKKENIESKLNNAPAIPREVVPTIAVPETQKPTVGVSPENRKAPAKAKKSLASIF
jgi:hypothetical protein